MNKNLFLVVLLAIFLVACSAETDNEQLAGAAIDVLPVEPPTGDEALVAAWRDPNHPAHDKVIINPHAAFYSEQGLDDMRIKVLELREHPAGYHAVERAGGCRGVQQYLPLYGPRRILGPLG